jgi:mono/diheme cytochrome c family protein
MVALSLTPIFSLCVSTCWKRELLRRLVTSSLVFAVSITLRLAPLSAAEATATLFTELCSVCHGVGGKGDGPSAQGLEPKPADFTNCKAMAKDSDDVLFKIIKGGGQSAGRSTVMPAWRDSLSDRQIAELVKFIRGLCKK